MAIVDRELFEKVQEKMTANDLKNENIERQTHGLLKGILFDDAGAAYSPACSRRNRLLSEIKSYACPFLVRCAGGIRTPESFDFLNQQIVADLVFYKQSLSYS